MHYLSFGRKCNGIIVRNKQNIIVKVSQVIIQINISQVEQFYAVWTENFNIWVDHLDQTFFKAFVWKDSRNSIFGYKMLHAN